MNSFIWICAVSKDICIGLRDERVKLELLVEIIYKQNKPIYQNIISVIRSNSSDSHNEEEMRTKQQQNFNDRHLNKEHVFRARTEEPSSDS